MHVTEAMKHKLIGNEQLKLGHYAAARDTYIEGLRGVFSAVEKLKAFIQVNEADLKDNLKLAHDIDPLKSDIEEIRIQLISNLSLTEVKMELWPDALSHANMVLVSDPMNMKALFRRSIARIHLKEQVEDALVDLQKLAHRDPKNLDIISAIASCRDALKQERESETQFKSSLRGSLKTKPQTYLSQWLSGFGDWFSHVNACSGIRNFRR